MYVCICRRKLCHGCVHRSLHYAARNYFSSLVAAAAAAASAGVLAAPAVVQICGRVLDCARMNEILGDEGSFC
jgi:hypothetical protein